MSDTTATAPQFTNALAKERSPYLLQHAHNPVNWLPWGDEAFAKAKAEDKPIFLSSGYSTCHWCHVMERESFENEDIAAFMNERFVCIKVDREERPDVDQVYMNAVQLLSGHGGWPLNCFALPDGRPVYGGTYFRPGQWKEVLGALSDLWKQDRAKVLKYAEQLTEGVRGSERIESRPQGGEPWSRQEAESMVEAWKPLFDRSEGGMNRAPKFPLPSNWRFLLRYAVATGDGEVLAQVRLTLDKMAQGGIYDQLGGGFARYSVDGVWKVPHFEKMLYDNAQLLDLLSRAHVASGDPLFRIRIEELVAWLDREMTLPGGAFAASIDADSEGEEGRFYVWSRAEIREVLGPDAPEFEAAYDVTGAGNWEGVTILNRSADRARWSRDREDRLARSRALLLDRRAGRVRPATDDKVLADWNGAMIHALVVAGRRLARPDFIYRAIAAYRFVSESMGEGDRLAHAWRDGRSTRPGLASDLAHMARAALALAETVDRDLWLADARRWMAALEEHHADPDGGWFLTADDAEALIVRPASPKDDATPNPMAIAVENCVRLSILAGEPHWRARAEEVLGRLSSAMLGDIFSTAALATALDFAIGAVEVVLIVPKDTDADALRRVVFESSDPRVVLFETESTADLPVDHPAAGKPAVAGLPTAWVCREGTCGLPVTEPAPLRVLLETGRHV
jgi:uncharacterized protein YyaL (SSP411 family)